MKLSVGQRFNRLEIIDLISTTGRGTKWKCRCDCGNIIEVTESKLITKHVQSCGCLRKANHIDLIGQKYNMLTVLRLADSTDKTHKSRSARWVCQCDCGNLTVVSSHALRSKSIKSCGCVSNNTVIDMTGMQFGKLTVLRRVDNNSHGSAQWLCRCTCGNEKVILGSNLRNGKTTSCGCYGKEVLSSPDVRQALRKYNRYELHEDYVTLYTNNGLPFLVDIDDFSKVYDFACWSASKKGYIEGRHDKQHYFLHRFIMNCPEDMYVDHISGDVLDNRKSNLRIVTIQQNQMNHKLHSTNTSGVSGVSWNKRSNKWHSRIIYKGKCYHLGYYDDINDAIQARYNAEMQYYGEYRRNRNSDDKEVHE